MQPDTPEVESVDVMKVTNNVGDEGEAGFRKVSK